ncbi:signal transduction histidine kinase [Amycolatopsis lexingtonensis]|uniref:histidine kinase n=1 Tax=Amycolatopsis lexingtonensis TaxID=218822 RepID=A0ABR9IDA6_9PSEU|nr:ATP-binding protein [Amycolatopsis lexingtonensis]MBE1501162.1 signal transduction histidine kinase [Amycolatopsis lexingtonensis]
MPKFFRSTRFRVAVTAFVASAVALGAVAVWFVLQAESRLRDTAAQLADAHAVAIVQLLNTGAAPGDLTLLVRDSIYEVVDRTGASVASCPVLRGAGLTVYDSDITLRPYEFDRADRRSVGCAPELRGLDDDLVLHVVHATSGDSKYQVYAGAQVDPEGQAAVDSVRTVLTFGVPAVALLIGVIAWLAVRRALRPVEAIRGEVAEIGAHDLGRRVPSPRSGDEIARLAGTMNGMLARLDEAVTRQSRFTSDASHELRTPLASLRTQLEVLLAHPDRLDWRHACENALLDVTRLQDLVADLVLLGKLDHAGPDRLEPVALSEVVEAVAAGHAEIEVTGAPVVSGQRSRLERLVRNLVDNARRHAVSRVVVEVSAVDGWVVLSVTDDGPGVPEADRRRVFDRFVRLDDARARDDGGSGLGLAIVADIARAHGGTAEVEAGSRFVVRLPELKRS